MAEPETRHVNDPAAPSPDTTVPLAALDVPQALMLCISLLAELAWQKLGLHINPATGQVHANLPQARLAIDSIAVLIEMVRAHVSDRDYEALRTQLMNLRLNYAEQARRHSGASGGSP